MNLAHRDASEETRLGRSGVHPAPLIRPHFIARSTKFKRALAQLERYARHDRATVLLQGESGTGKTYFALQLHLSSPRAHSVFHRVVLSCLNDGLAGSDLFGHVAGAFTDARRSRNGHFVAAHRGTLFLDEIGKASPAVQRQLLHAIECGEVWPVGADHATRVDVRVCLATNVALESVAEEGKFLPDLLARLGCFRIHIPPLRERRADISGLIDQFLRLRAEQYGYPPKTIPRVQPELVRALEEADWPYNLRQLDGTVQRLLADAERAPVITLEHCTGDLDYLRPRARRRGVLLPSEAERALEREGSKAAAARCLGVDRSTLYRALERVRADLGTATPVAARGDKSVSLPLVDEQALSGKTRNGATADTIDRTVRVGGASASPE